MPSKIRDGMVSAETLMQMVPMSRRTYYSLFRRILRPSTTRNQKSRDVHYYTPVQVTALALGWHIHRLAGSVAAVAVVNAISRYDEETLVANLQRGQTHMVVLNEVPSHMMSRADADRLMRRHEEQLIREGQPAIAVPVIDVERAWHQVNRSIDNIAAQEAAQNEKDLVANADRN